MWLVSVSKRNPKTGQIVPNTRWPDWVKDKARKALWQVMSGAGDLNIGWRLFRMNITYCLHIAVSDRELELLPVVWQDQMGTALAGGPVAVLDSGNCATSPSVLPCEHPTREPLPLSGNQLVTDPDMWFPRDCRLCEPCLDRIRIEEMIGGEAVL